MTASTRAPSRGRAGIIVAAVIIAVVVVVGLVGVGDSDRTKFDPESTAPQGTAAVVELIRSFGATVEIARGIPEDADVAIMYEDVVPDGRVDELRDWVGQGPTLVIADPRSALTPLARPSELDSTGFLRPGQCSIRAFANVDSLYDGDPGAFALRYVQNGARQVCFAGGGEAFAVLDPIGRGQVVGLGSPHLFTNEHLGREDNAVLVTDLLAPRPGLRVAIITANSFPIEEGGGGGAGIDPDRLLRPPIVAFVWQLALAGGLLALAMGRRVGRPIAEPQPVAIAGSELVSAMGRLLELRKDPTSSAAVLRADLRRLVASRLALPATAEITTLAEGLSARIGIAPEDARWLLEDRPIENDTQLLELARRIDAVREEVLHGRTP